MIESMACGTPVIAFKRGSVPEVIDQNKSGFIVEDEEAMIECLKNIPSIDRKDCREIAQQRFDVTVIAQQYLDLFKN